MFLNIIENIYIRFYLYKITFLTIKYKAIQIIHALNYLDYSFE